MEAVAWSLVGMTTHEQEANGDGNAEPTVPTISFRDVSDQEVVHIVVRLEEKTKHMPALLRMQFDLQGRPFRR